MSSIKLANGDILMTNELDEGGRMKAFINGREWRDLSGDVLILKMYEEIERLRKGLELIGEESTCDDTWDYANRLLLGEYLTHLTYRIGGEDE